MLETSEDVEVPSIYVNQDLLGHVPVSGPTYTVNGVEFHEQETNTEELQQFVVKMDTDGDIYCYTPSGSESDCGDEPRALSVTLQQINNGFIVNGSCYLSWQQWNTLVTPAVSAKLVQCIVCAQYCEVSASSDHVSTANHRLWLQAFPPSEKHDISVTRKIRNQYHCGVCNEVFAEEHENEHFSSKLHEGNQLFAINKASDILDTSLEHNNNLDTYHFKTHSMDGYVNDNESIDSDSYPPLDNTNFINFQNNYYYDDFEDETPIFTGLSYATMAKKPKAPTQNLLEIDLGSKKVSIRHDSWHMVISPKPNQYWCMVCKKAGHIRNKQAHCSEMDHLHNLDDCKVVEAYEDYFIRQVDDKLYHCGHCNNLQLIHEMEDHVETNHPRRKLVTDTKNERKTTAVKNDTLKNDANVTNNKDHIDSPKKVTIQSTNKNTVNVKNIPTPINNNDRNIKNTTNNITPAPTRNVNNNTINNGVPFYKMPGLFEDIILERYGYKIRVPSSSYNIICKRPMDYYCGLCNVICQENIIQHHMFEAKHIELLNRTPFIEPFGVNLIRAIREALHCTICNLPVPAVNIYPHLQDPIHIQNLSKALTQPKLPPIGVKIPNIPQMPSGVKSPCFATPNLSPRPSPNSFGTPNLSPKISPNAALNTVGINIKGAVKGINVANNGINAANNGFTAANNGISAANKGFTAANKGISAANIGFNAANNGISAANNGFTAAYKGISAANNGLTAANNGMAANESFAAVNDGLVNNKNNFENIRQESKAIQKEEEYNYEEESDDEEVDLERTFDSIASEDVQFDLEEHVYLKLKNTYIKISNTSYNTLVHSGDGSRYCFVCAVKVEFVDMQKHVDSRPHLENMDKYMFLEKYEDHLLRQIYLMYHCAICNVIIYRKELKTHLEWRTHASQNETLKNVKKTRKNEIKGGVKQIVVSIQKENIYINDNEPKIKIYLNAEVSNNSSKNSPQPLDNASPPKEQFSRKNKIIIFNDNVLKVAWDSWHGISKVKSGVKCNLCQRDLKSKDIDVHCASEWHRYGLDKPFEKQYAPALIRKINEHTLHCLFCNTEVAAKESVVQDHVRGKRHMKSYEAILHDSSLANTYTDCHDDVLTL